MIKKFPNMKLPESVKPGDPFVGILDPATGTGTFLFTCIEVIERTMKDKWCRELGKKGWNDPEILARWREYVPRHLLPRLYGYELMMAPYAIAHLKLALKLGETGYQFREGDRLHIYLTNSLEPPSELADRKLADLFATLAKEAQEVNDIKRHKRFTVVIGNPPYSVSTQNRGTWANSLIERYKEGLNEKKHTLDDDYVKFVALGQWYLNESGGGVWGFITNHGYVKNPTFRGMRRSLLRSFSILHVYDLHGNLRQKEQKETGDVDENVFDIQQGVVITLGTKTVPTKAQTEASSAELWGTRAEKYRLLSESSLRSTNWRILKPCEPFYLLVPQNEAIREEYVRCPSVADAFVCYGSGIKTDRDELCMDSTKSELATRMKLLFSGKYDANFVERYNVRPSSSYDVVELARRTQFSETDMTPCLYRPFDVRWLYYKRGFTSRPAYEVMQHMLPGSNIGLLSARTNKSGKMDHFFCTRLPTEVKVAESTTQSCLFPLFLADGAESLQLKKFRAANFSQSFVRNIVTRLGLAQKGLYGLPDGLNPEDIFQYAYAVFHSPGYRSRYAEFLKIDFPRLPLISSLELFRALARLGSELIALHLLKSPKLEKPITRFVGNATPEIEKISYARETVWIDKAQTTGFKGVPEGVWNFHIGGYQVCEKWLKDRKGRTLSKDDIAHYHKIVVALSETISLMKEIDEVIDKQGGWPGAFASTGYKESPETEMPLAAEASASYGKGESEK
jgi:predicted helicase